MLRVLVKNIPNLLTLTNAFLGSLSIAFIFKGEWATAIACIAGALVADFLDGFLARKLNALSPLGKDLDSLADAISFGAAPAAMLYSVLAYQWSAFAWLSFLLVPASVYRLAKFNHDTRQTRSFIGLPTPANALFWLGIAYTLRAEEVSANLLVLTLAGVVFFSWLLVSEIPMFSLKGGGESKWPLVVILLVAVVALLLYGVGGIAIAIGTYVLLNIARNINKKKSA